MQCNSNPAAAIDRAQFAGWTLEDAASLVLMLPLHHCDLIGGGAAVGVVMADIPDIRFDGILVLVDVALHDVTRGTLASKDLAILP